MWRVCCKKMVRNIKLVLDPDTYSRETAGKVKEGVIKYKVEAVSLILIVGLPLMIIYPMLRPRLKRIKR